MSSKSSSKFKQELVSVFWTALLILFVRGFLVEPFKIPSGSMIPTLLVGDHIFVAKSAYDLRIPFTSIPVVKVSNPKHGDVVVFDYPNYEQSEENEGKYYIKRLLGVPGDRIRFSGGVPFYESAQAEQIVQQRVPSDDEIKSLSNFYFAPGNALFLETLPGAKAEHWVQRYPYTYRNIEQSKEELRAYTGKDCINVGEAIREPTLRGSPTRLNEICAFTVPENYYFFTGDNRDDSADSREWGFVERNRLRGRALFIWLSLLPDNAHPTEGGPLLRWKRFGRGI